MCVDLRIQLNHYTFVAGKTIQGWIEQYFLNSHIFPNFWCLFYQLVPYCLRYYHCVSIRLIIQEVIKYFHLFADSCIGANCQHRDFTGRVLPWENFIRPKTTNFTHTNFFSGKKQISICAPFAQVVQPIRSPENPRITVVCIGHWTSWLENCGYRTQVWDNIPYLWLMQLLIHTGIWLDSSK